MKSVNIHEAKTQFSRIIRRVAAGEKITISRRGVAVAVISPAPAGKGQQLLGMFHGEFAVPEDFDAPLPGSLQDLFEGRAKQRSKESKRNS